MTRYTRRPYLLLATLILLLAATLRLWHLGTVPPGLLVEELHNAQLADRIRMGEVAVVYDQVAPAREGLYNALLAVSSAVLGRGVILWRLPSVWLSLIGLSVTFSLLRRLFNGRVALITAAYLAVTFWPIWMGRAVLHVTLLPLATASFGYAMARAFNASQPEDAGLWFTVTGIVLGVAQYMHVIAWGLPVIMLAFAGYLAVTRRAAFRQYRANIAFALALAAAIFFPLFVYVVGHPGVRVPVRLTEQPGWLAMAPQRLLYTLSGLFLRGDSSPNRNLPFRPIMDPLSGALFIVGAGVALARWRRSSYGLLIVWFVLGLIPALLVPHVPNFEYMALVLPVVFAFPAVALDEVLKLARRRPAVFWALGELAALLIAGNAVWTARDVFTRWPYGGDVRFNYQTEVASLAHFLDTNGGDVPVGLCVTPVEDPDDPFALGSDELLTYFMHRSALPIRKFDCRQTLVLAGRGGDQLLIFPQAHYYDELPGPLLAWLRYSREEAIPGVPPGVVRRLEADGQLDTFLRVAQTAPVTWPPEASGGPGPTSLPVTFTDDMRLEGYEVRDRTLMPGEAIDVATYWQALQPVSFDVRLVANLRAGPGQIVATTEDWGADLSTIQPGDIIVQYNLLQPIRSQFPDAGEYALAVGMFVPDTDHRLRALNDGSPYSDRLLLQNVIVLE